MKKMKSQLDEMQELRLLKVESRAFWFTWTVLLLAIIVQTLVYGFQEGAKLMVGEWIVFTLACFYVLVGCLRIGVWDRRLKPNFRTNILGSTLGAICAGLVVGFSNYRSFGLMKSAVFSGLICGISTFILCMAALSALSAYYKKRKKALEEESPEQ